MAIKKIRRISGLSFTSAKPFEKISGFVNTHSKKMRAGVAVLMLTTIIALSVTFNLAQNKYNSEMNQLSEKYETVLAEKQNIKKYSDLGFQSGQNVFKEGYAVEALETAYSICLTLLQQEDPDFDMIYEAVFREAFFNGYYAEKGKTEENEEVPEDTTGISDEGEGKGSFGGGSGSSSSESYQTEIVDSNNNLVGVKIVENGSWTRAFLFEKNGTKYEVDVQTQVVNGKTTYSVNTSTVKVFDGNGKNVDLTSLTGGQSALYQAVASRFASVFSETSEVKSPSADEDTTNHSR